MALLVRYFTICLLATFVASGCRSVSPKITEKEPVSAVEATSITQESELNDAVSGTLKNVGVPLEPIDVKLSQKLEAGSGGAQSGHGILRCKFENGFATCFLQDASGVESLLQNAVSQVIRTRLIEARKDVASEPILISDISCASAGENTPPYTGKDAKCRFERVRAVNENIFDGDVAFEIAALLRSELILGTALNDLSGVVSCRVLQRNVNVQCTVRRMIAGGISEDARALGRKESVEVSEKIIETIKEIRKNQSFPPSTQFPGELAGSLRCLIDGKALEDSGQRANMCFVRL